MARKYSLYEAKAKLSAIVRMVREGSTVVITVHGKPAAELRPYVPTTEADFEARVKELTERGVIVPARTRGKLPAPVAKRPGALKRFLAERD